MEDKIVIALDAMGGDHSPRIVIEGAALRAHESPFVYFLFYGDQKLINPIIEENPILKGRSEVYHTDVYISNDVKPSVALRTGKHSSMRLAIEAVEQGKAASVVSAGNTGALMAMAKIILRPLDQIDRPAIACLIPNQRGSCVMLDLGANVNCTSQHLIEFTLMGIIYARTILKIENPTYGLLNIGTEEIKGLDVIKEAAQSIRNYPLPGQFIGFVEPDGIHRGDADVVVCDGFIGNISLKTSEGTAKLLMSWLKKSFQESPFWVKLGYFLVKPALNRLKLLADPRRYNGAMFLGLKGICVKSHGGTDSLGFSNAIKVAEELVRCEYNKKIQAEVDKHQQILLDAIAL